MDFAFFKNRTSSPWLALALIGIGVFVIYGNVYKSPFVFDDVPKIVENKTIRDLSNFFFLSKLLEPRAVVDFTFALNYRFGQLNVFGYHLVNVLIHILNGWLVYFLVLTILKQLPQASGLADPTISKSPDFSIRTISLFAALIFAVHPIQTQAVTYTVQRYASMAAMFYMASVLFYLKARIIQQNAKRLKRIELEQDGTTHTFKLSSLYVLAILCGILAFLSKQNTASLPLVILLVELLLIQGTWQQWKQKLPWFALFFSLWILFVLYITGLFSDGFAGSELLEDVSGLMKETETVGRWQYLCTQFNVLVVYIKLLFLPVKQNLDYLYPFKSGFFDDYTPFAFLFLIGLFALAAWQIKKRPIISLAIFWFFISLAVESSIIPISDALFEHRLYLPMFGFGLFVSFLIFHYLFPKRSLACVLLLAIVVPLGAATYKRNMTWQDEKTLWSDVVSKSPYNYRAHNNLGKALKYEGRLDEAIAHYQQALQIHPDYQKAHNNLAVVLSKQGRKNQAMDHYLKALRINPDSAETYYNLGNLMASLGRWAEAVSHFLKALQIDPDDAESHNNLGNVLIDLGRLDEAVKHYAEALRIDPANANAHNNLGNILSKQGRLEEAIKHYSEALQIDPAYAEAHNNLGVTLAETGRSDQALNHYLEALRLNPDHVEAYMNLGTEMNSRGSIDEAIHYYQKALSLQPELPEAIFQLAKLYINRREYEKALSLYHKMIALLPDNPAGYYNVACIYARQNKPKQSVSWLKKAVAKGLNDWEHIKTDKDLDNIRSSLQYKAFVKGH